MDWVQVDDLDFVLHTEKLTSVCVTGTDYITADPFVVENLDMRLVAAIVLHPCDEPTGLVKRFQYPAYGLKQCDLDTRVELCNWCDDVQTLDCDEPKFDPCESPCSRYARLYQKLETLACGEAHASMSARDRQIAFNRADLVELRKMTENAKIECDMSRGVSTGRRWRVDCPGDGHGGRW